MAPDLPAMIERTTRLRATLAGSPLSEALLEEIEDALCAGYAGALSGDAWSMRTERRLRELVGDGLTPARRRELRAVASESERLAHDLVVLRQELAELRHDRDRLHTARPVPSA